MDSFIGHCWNCNEKSAELQCRCRVAKYCNKQCLDQDIFRHQAECNFMGNFGNCSECKKLTQTKWCQNCRKDRYCSEKCQKKHWNTHEPICKFVDSNYEMMLKNYYFSPKLEDVPWYWGNTLAVDYLKLFQNEGIDCEQKQFRLLFAACGDLRNIVKTVADLPTTYLGKLEFYLNDCCVHVMARNVLFLYLCCTIEDSCVCSHLIVQLWYSLLISERNHNLLMNALERLSCFSLDQIQLACRDLIKIPEEYLNRMKLVWKVWHFESKKGKSCWDLTKQWLLRASNSDVKRFHDSHLAGVPDCYKKSLEEWLITGLLLKTSEKHKIIWKPNLTLCFISPHSELAKQFPEISPTLLPQDWMSTDPKNSLILFWDGMAVPFQGWDYLDVAKSQSLDDNDTVGMFQVYIEDVMKKFISSIRRHNILFSVFVEDIISLKDQLPHNIKFDRIATSNMTDYYPETTLLKALAPFLNKDNPHSVLVAEYHAWFVKIPYRLFKISSQNITEQVTDHCKWYSNLPDSALMSLQREQDKSVLSCIGDLILRKTADNYTNNIQEEIYCREYFDPFFDFMLTKRVDRFVSDIYENSFEGFHHGSQISFEAKSSLSMIMSTLVARPNQAYECCGLKSREFWNELNHIVPFRYKMNARRINYIGGYERAVEWIATE